MAASDARSDRRSGEIVAEAPEVTSNMQLPLMAVVRDLDQDAAVAQERAAWSLLAQACEEGLRLMDARHPERVAFVEMWTECRQAAGLPLSPCVSQTA